MIPKIIHYCWFGRGKMPQLALDCIASWKKYLPEYEFMLWNEDSFNIDKYPYARQAYDHRKFAFVTDLVRMYALYNYGGVYMDTDVEIIKSLDPFLHHKAFSGFECKDRIPTGLIASEKGGIWVKAMLDEYNGRNFILEDGTMDLSTNVKTITNYMLNRGLVLNNEYQDLGDIVLYPSDFFCPCDWETKILKQTKNTVCIHHFAGSWRPKLPRVMKFKQWLCDTMPFVFMVLHKIKHRYA